MNLDARAVAEGADRFRQPGAIEWLADRLARLPIGPSIRRRLKTLYHLALTVQTRGRGLLRVLPGGEAIRVLPEYAYLSWNPDEYRAFRDVVRPGMVALDIGANVGAYSLVLGGWVGASGKVFAFEPAPDTFRGLLRHVLLNELAGIVKPVRAAAGQTPSNARFLVADSAGEGRLAAPSEEGAPAISVPVTTIDEFCARERIVPDFIKIDVEGSELAVLRGARRTILAGRGRLALFVEMHPSVWPTVGVTREDVEAELRSLRLAPQAIAPVHDAWAIEGICLRLVDTRGAD